MQTWYK